MDLGITFGWDVESVADDVSRALAEGDQTFFASGGITCPAVGVPDEYQHVVQSTFTIYCGCTVFDAVDEETTARIRHQRRYAAAYNRELLSRISDFDLHPALESVVGQLPSGAALTSAKRLIRDKGRRSVESGGFFLDTSPRAVERSQNQAAAETYTLGWGARFIARGLVSVGHEAWYFAGARFPEERTAYFSELEEESVWMTPISTIRDEAIYGAHLTLFVQTPATAGWMLLTFTDDASAVSGTLLLSSSLYRVVSSPYHEYKQLLLLAHDFEEAVSRELLMNAISSSPRILEVEKRHQAVYASWAEILNSVQD